MSHNIKYYFILLLLFMKQMSVDNKSTLKNDASCPRPTVGKCSCEWIGPFAKVTCTGLDDLPGKLPAENTTNLKITNGNIKKIPDNYFLPFKYLQSLELQYNKISTPFRLPKSLWTLNLRANMLNSSNLHGMFDGLSKLRTLDVSFNPISGNIIPGTFSSLRKLEELSIRNCQLTDIKEGTFIGLIHLHLLNLQSNNLQILRKGALKGIKSQPGEQMILNILSNNIAYIEDGTFEDAKPIGHLILNGNRLTVLPAGSTRNIGREFTFEVR